MSRSHRRLLREVNLHRQELREEIRCMARAIIIDLAWPSDPIDRMRNQRIERRVMMQNMGGGCG